LEKIKDYYSTKLKAQTEVIHELETELMDVKTALDAEIGALSCAIKDKESRLGPLQEAIQTRNNLRNKLESARVYVEKQKTDPNYSSEELKKKKKHMEECKWQHEINLQQFLASGQQE